MTDHYCDDLFDVGFDMVRACVSRLACDTERFRSDLDEVMSQKGMGAVYTTCSDGSELRRVTENSLFAGTMVPLKYYNQDKRVLSIMIEINRRLYIDESAKKIERYDSVKQDISHILNSFTLQ